jgi:dihydropyrimidinase
MGTVSADDFANGAKSAACGGVTTFIDFAIQKKGGTLLEAIEQRRAQAEGAVAVDYSLHSVPTDWNEKTKKEVASVMNYGISTFKLFMVYRDEGLMSDDGALYEALEMSAKLGALICVHAESVNILDIYIKRYHTPELMAKFGAYCHALSRPHIVETEAINRALYISEATGGNLYIVHMSTGKGADLVKDSKAKELKVFAETIPYYLLLNDDLFKGKDGHLFATAPQLKKDFDNERLWQGLANGEISVVATDTCTFNRSQKGMWKGDFTKIPCGMPGIETLLPIMFTFGIEKSRFSVEKLVEIISTNPAKLMGLFPQKGSVSIGADADLVILNPNTRQKIDCASLQTNCDWNPYQGWETVGMPEYTILRGEVVAKKGKFVGKTGWGKFVNQGLPVYE